MKFNKLIFLTIIIALSFSSCSIKKLFQKKEQEPINSEIMIEEEVIEIETIEMDEDLTETYVEHMFIEEEEEPEGGSIFVIVEEMALFNGAVNRGESNLLLKEYIENALAAIEYTGSGKVYISFVVEKDGSTSNVRILRGIETQKDNIALNLVRELPAFIPAKQRGEEVRLQMNIPINFKEK